MRMAGKSDDERLTAMQRSGNGEPENIGLPEPNVEQDVGLHNIKVLSKESVASPKRQRKLTAKGIELMVERLQKDINKCFKRASKLQSEIKDIFGCLVSKENVSAVSHKIEKFESLCEKATEQHNILLNEFLLPEADKGKQKAWFCKITDRNKNFVEQVNTWLRENENVDDDENLSNNYAGGHPKQDIHDDIQPADSASNVSSKDLTRLAPQDLAKLLCIYRLRQRKQRYRKGLLLWTGGMN